MSEEIYVACLDIFSGAVRYEKIAFALYEPRGLSMFIGEWKDLHKSMPETITKPLYVVRVKYKHGAVGMRS